MGMHIRRTIREYLVCWWEYGAKGWERVFRILILTLCLASFGLFIVTLVGGEDTVPRGLRDELRLVSGRVDLEKFSVALGITSAILAGACATFVAALAQHVVSTRTVSEDQMAPRAVMSLLVAFLAAVVATLTFGGLASVKPLGAVLLHWATMIAALVQLLASAVLIVFTLVLLIPNHAHRRLADELVRVLSWSWVIFFSLLAALVASAPKMEEYSVPLVFLALSVTMGQILVAHGHVRLSRGNVKYDIFLDRMRTRANTLFSVAAVVTTAFLVAVVVGKERSRSLVISALYVLVLLWSLALVFLQIWVEGTRKKERYPDFPRDFL